MIINHKTPRIIEQWASSIKKRSPELMTKFYCNESILLATYDTLLIGKSEISKYFISFLNKKNLRCTINRNYTQVIDNRSFVASGIYTFEFLDDEKNNKVEARYSFVVKDGIIINHHSSEVPN
tara:strand:- start:1890 stop:2258 length:369 start_codon:yes stop_codon:yes gene_type:complete